MFEKIVSSLGGLSNVGIALTTFVGGAVSHLLNSTDVAAALATMAATAAGGPVWKGALAAGALAVFGKALANAKPPAQ